MAKVIRNCYVYRPNNRVWRHLPRRVEGRREYDFEKNQAMPRDFPDKLQEEPSKLLLVWLYRGLSGEPKWTKEKVKKLLGDVTPGKMHIFKNTESYNNELWHIKHLIEVKPLKFPNGEPTEEDIYRVEVQPDGNCIIDKEKEFKPETVTLVDPMKQMTTGYLSSRLAARYNSHKEIFEDTVYGSKDISVVD
uniref:39S ribosomal protein L30, mitochondrial n=1 Tax=Strongyloides venezuelensis TaxID=75913 RepID=A0A0K0FUM3_STRVS